MFTIFNRRKIISDMLLGVGGIEVDFLLLILGFFATLTANGEFVNSFGGIFTIILSLYLATSLPVLVTFPIIEYGSPHLSNISRTFFCPCGKTVNNILS